MGICVDGCGYLRKRLEENRKGCECENEKARRCVFDLWKTTCIL